MKKIKTFENFIPPYGSNVEPINIILDVSGSISYQDIKTAIYNISKISDSDNITLIKVSDQVESVEEISNLEDILDIQNHKVKSGGSDLQPAIDYIVDNDLKHNKTFIISDFISREPDYSELEDYEEIYI